MRKLPLTYNSVFLRNNIVPVLACYICSTSRTIPSAGTGTCETLKAYRIWQAGVVEHAWLGWVGRVAVGLFGLHAVVLLTASERLIATVIDDPAGSAAGERAIIPPLGARTLDSRPPIWTILLEAFAPKSHHQPFRSIHDRVQHAVRPPVCTFNLPAVYKHGRTFGSP